MSLVDKTHPSCVRPGAQIPREIADTRRDRRATTPPLAVRGDRARV